MDNSQPMMDVCVGVEGSERGRKRRKKAGEEVDRCFGSGQTVSASFGPLHFRHIQIKAQVKDTN